MDINTQVKLTQKSNLLAKEASVTFREILQSPASRETSFCGERFCYESCIAHPWEIYELENRKLL